MIRVGICGATGYTGLELVRLLSGHPKVEITHLFSSSKSGQAFSSLYPQFMGAVDLILESFEPSGLPDSMDVLFLALPHGQTHAIMPKIIESKPDLKVIDLSSDFRIKSLELHKKYYEFNHNSPELIEKSVLGIPEIYRDQIRNAMLCANPGCYAISVILALYPIIKEGISGQIIIDAKSGVSGAGKTLKETSMFCEANENVLAYNTGMHRHLAEMKEVLAYDNIMFSPHLIPQNRGILSSIYIENSKKITSKDLVGIFKKFYQKEKFVKVIEDLATPSTKYVVGSNFCIISPRVVSETNTIVIFSVLDNLLKGASGQAVQNMNIMFGIDESLGLPTVASYL